jgi:hypothetical protein
MDMHQCMRTTYVHVRMANVDMVHAHGINTPRTYVHARTYAHSQISVTKFQRVCKTYVCMSLSNR